MKVEKLFRNFEIRKADLDEKSRTVALTFSSEEPVDRWFGTEILDHQSGSVRLERLRNGGPLLWNHNTDDQIGVIEGAAIVQGRGSAQARFSKSVKGDEVFQDVMDGIRRNVSVGYRVHEMVRESKEKDHETYRVTDWEPLEISIVSVAADAGVGIGRNEKVFEVRVLNFEKEDEKTMKDDKDFEKEEKTERWRVREILAMGQKCKIESEALEAVKNGDSVDDFRKVCFEKISTKPQPITTDVRDLQAERPFRTFGEQLVAIARSSSPGGDVDKRLSYLQRAASGMGGQIPSEGGFLIQSDFSLALLNKAREEAILAPRCTRIPIAGDSIDLPLVDEVSRATGSRWGGVQCKWVSEGDTTTATKPKIGNISLKLEKLLAICYVTDEILRDASALEFIVGSAFGSEMGFRIDDGIINGAGAGQPLGILKSPALVSVAKEAGQAAATVVYENLTKMWARMPGRNRKNAVWLLNQEVEPQLFTLGLSLGTGGAPVWMPGGGASEQPYSTLFGRPMIPIEQASALGTLGDIMLTDLTQYLLIDKGGPEFAYSIHVRFIYDENTFRGTYRVNGCPTWKSPLTPFKGSSAATLSPFVALAIRA